MSRSLFLKMSVLTLVVVMMIITSLAAGDLLVSAFAPEPGEPIVASPVGLVGVGAPELPADATTVVPASVALSEATEVG